MTIPAYFNPSYFSAGQRIEYSGFTGSIIRHYCEGMWEIRLPGGVACVSGAHIKPAA